MSEDENKKVILAVDDAPENLDVVKGLLSPQYTVKAAVNGQMALKIAEKQPPDLILLDIRMPGMDGYEVCRRLKADESTADIPVIFLTGEDDVTAEVTAVGGTGYIMKPIEPDVLLARVEDCLKSSI
jgi:putative two-component system response regulator